MNMLPNMQLITVLKYCIVNCTLASGDFMSKYNRVQVLVWKLDHETSWNLT